MKDYKGNSNLNFLVGKSIDQICFGIYQVQLNFSEAASISAESKLNLTTVAESFEFHQPYSQAGKLLALLGAEVVKAQANENGDLLLEFSNQSALEVMNDNTHYESYQITNGSSSIVVDDFRKVNPGRSS